MNPNLCVTRDRGYFAATLVLLLCGSMIGGAASKSFAQPSSTVPADHAQKMGKGLELFKTRVRPMLVENCLRCHDSKAKKGDFDLSTREALMAGGMVSDSAESSQMFRVVAHKDKPYMPQGGAQLPDQAVKDIAAWIGMGAPYDRPLTEIAGEKKPKEVTEIDKQYWAFLPLANPLPPEVKQSDWCRGPIDHFLLAKMEAAQIKPVPEADRAALVRRVYFDLIGLPPTPAEIDEVLLAKDFDKAWQDLVDRLLASPHYGERWGRHWLDCARFAESTGFEHDYDRPNAYHFRDCVIRAFNSDMPYDKFLQWQLAGDELAPDDPDAWAMTGFIGAGVFPTQITTSEAERIRYDAMDDMLATTGNAMLGLTVGCARCHDHKYDPIPTRNYYRLLSTFTTTVRSDVEWDEQTRQIKSAPKPIRKSKTAKPTKAVAEKTATAKTATVKTAIAKPAADKPAANVINIQATTEGLTPSRHHKADESIPDFYANTYYLKRGDVAQKDGEAPLGFLDVLVRHPDGAKHWTITPPPEARTSFRRSSLARWITDADYGAGNLAARVIVNRLWHYHFGRGIVATINDFGLQGDRPSHPELLEYLASDLVAGGWKLKRLHREILLSQAYRLSGMTTAENMAKDPDDRLWWRRPRRRLEAEVIRDNLLSVANQLDPAMFGPGTLNESMNRRSVYFTVKRSRMVPLLQVFDWPDTLTAAGVRPTTITPPQALVFLNHPMVRHAAEALGARLKPAAEKSLSTAVDDGYRIVFGRLPNDKERASGIAELEAGRKSHGNLDRALSDYAWELLSLNEFIYVD